MVHGCSMVGTSSHELLGFKSHRKALAKSGKISSFAYPVVQNLVYKSLGRRHITRSAAPQDCRLKRAPQLSFVQEQRAVLQVKRSSWDRRIFVCALRAHNSIIACSKALLVPGICRHTPRPTLVLVSRKNHLFFDAEPRKYEVFRRS